MPLVRTRQRDTRDRMPVPRAWEPLRFHPTQNALWTSDKRFCAVAAGRGSGKTVLAKRRIVKELRTPNGVFFYALPTYKQAKKVAWRDLKQLVPTDWLAKKPNETDLYIETTFNSILYVVGMDAPERIEGEQYNGGVLDEMSDQKPYIFERTCRPALTHKKGWCWLIGAIKASGVGSGWFQDFCFSASVHHTPKEGMVHFPERDPNTGYYNWPSSDIVDKEEIESAKLQLDELTFNTQMNATWQTLRGGVFYAFDESVNVSSNAYYHPQYPIAVGSDFNVDPMSWVIGHFYGGHLYIFDEIFIRNTNTQNTLDELYRRYGTHQMGFWFFGDASSRARKTSAATTDYLLIKNDPRFQNAEINYPAQNPPILDRFSSTNAAFRNAAGHSRCTINPQCARLIKDIKQRSYKEGTREPNDSGDIGHMTDAFGYICYRLFPPALEQSGATTITTS